MKKLEELEISPAPWSHTDDGMGYRDIKCDRKLSKDDYEGEDIIAELVEEKDACMMSAAPEMYEALFEALPWLADIGAEVVGNESAAKIAAIVKKGEAALAKASGEVTEK